jgi:hypothetical protein
LFGFFDDEGREMEAAAIAEVQKDIPESFGVASTFALFDAADDAKNRAELEKIEADFNVEASLEKKAKQREQDILKLHNDRLMHSKISAESSTGVSYDSATGVISLITVPNVNLTNSDITINGYTIALGDSLTLNADDIAEAAGGTNRYFTEARFDTSLATKTTTDVAEGTNLYYTQARFNSAFAAKSTTDLAEGTNLYHTTSRARNALSGGTGVTYTASTGEIAIGQDVSTTSESEREILK